MKIKLYYDRPHDEDLVYIIRGRARGPAGFDAPFNMGSTKCEIEWNSNFEVRYLTDLIKLKHKILNTNQKNIIEIAYKKIALTQIKRHFHHRVNMAPWHARTAEKTHA